MGDNINNAIDSVGTEPTSSINTQSTQYMQLATGTGCATAEHPINPNVMKFQQIQNSLPPNSNHLRPLNKEKFVQSRTRTIMRAGPTISGSSPNMNEDHMDEQMQAAPDSASDQDLAPFHEEYRAEYPNFDAHYTQLKHAFTFIRNSLIQAQILEVKEYDVQTLVKRHEPENWLKDELLTKFFAQPQPSDSLKSVENLVFTSQMITPNGEKFVQSDKYQDIHMCTVLNQSMIQGKTYVGIGSVDNTNLLFAQLENEGQTLKPDPVKYYGVDTNPICVARSLIINEMLKNGAHVDSIFEVWYLSCVSQDTIVQLQKAVKSILDSNCENLQQETIKVLKHWQDNTVSIEDSQDAWTKSFRSINLHPLGNMISKSSRLKFTRYKLAGVFGQNKDYAQGNPTLFASSPTLNPKQYAEDCMFHSFAIINLIRKPTLQAQESDDVIGHIIQIYKNNIAVLQERIQNGQIECHYSMMETSLEEEVKNAKTQMKNLAEVQLAEAQIQLQKLTDSEGAKKEITQEVVEMKPKYVKYEDLVFKNKASSNGWPYLSNLGSANFYKIARKELFQVKDEYKQIFRQFARANTLNLNGTSQFAYENTNNGHEMISFPRQLNYILGVLWAGTYAAANHQQIKRSKREQERSKWSTVPISVFLNKEDPLLSQKLNYTKNHKSKTFRVGASLDQKIMIDFVSFIRISVYEGDDSQLFLAKNEAKHRNYQKSEYWEDEDFSEWAMNSNPWGLENEIKVWLMIDSLVDEFLSIYDTSYQQDLELIEKDDKKKCLDRNQRNYILNRADEKKILLFLKDKAKVFAGLTKLSQEDAKKEVDQLKDFDHCLNYFENCILPNLSTHTQEPKLIAQGEIADSQKQKVSTTVEQEAEEESPQIPQTKVFNYIANNKVMMFSKSQCPLCKKAKAQLKNANIEFHVVEMDTMADGDEIYDALISISMQDTVPNIYIGGTHIGNYVDLYTKLENGKVKTALDIAGVTSNPWAPNSLI